MIAAAAPNKTVPYFQQWSASCKKSEKRLRNPGGQFLPHERIPHLLTEGLPRP
jgi:hypothetical protein